MMAPDGKIRERWPADITHRGEPAQQGGRGLGAGEESQITEVSRQEFRGGRSHQHRVPVIVDETRHQRASVALDSLHRCARRICDPRTRDRLDHVADHQHVRGAGHSLRFSIEDPDILEHDR